MVKVASSSFSSQGGELLRCDSKIGFGKCWNRDTIFKAVNEYVLEAKSWHDLTKRDTILSGSEHFKGIPWPICWPSLVNLMDTKGGNF